MRRFVPAQGKPKPISFVAKAVIFVRSASSSSCQDAAVTTATWTDRDARSVARESPIVGRRRVDRGKISESGERSQQVENQPGTVVRGT
jgi:hypothetical protein